MPLERWNVATILLLSPLPGKIPLRFIARLAPVLHRSATGAAGRCSFRQSASMKAWLSKPARVRASVLAGRQQGRGTAQAVGAALEPGLAVQGMRATEGKKSAKKNGYTANLYTLAVLS